MSQHTTTAAPPHEHPPHLRHHFETLTQQFDAGKLGTMETRILRVLTEPDVAEISDAYHAWHETGDGYADEPGFCKSATTK